MPVLCEYAVRKIRKKQWLTGAISASLKDTGLSRRCHAALEFGNCIYAAGQREIMDCITYVAYRSFGTAWVGRAC